MTLTAPSTTYDLGSWSPDARTHLVSLLRGRDLTVHWVGEQLVVPTSKRAQVDDLIAYLNGTAAPGMTAASTRTGVLAGGSGGSPPPAWHPNPEDPATWRWWDGARWTSFTVPAPPVTRSWFPARSEARATTIARGSLIALVGFVVAELLSIGLVFAAIELGAEERSVVTLIAGGFGLWAGLLGACVVAVRRHGTGSLRDLGLSGVRRSDVGTGVVASIVARIAGAAVAVAIVALFPDESYGSSTSIVDRGRPSTLALIVVALFVCVGAPFFEELFFRGLVQGALTGRVGAPIAVVLQAGLFAAAHFQVGMSLGTAIVTFTVIGIAGLTLGMVRWHTDRLGAGMITHAAYNLVAVVILFFVL
ncbi:MAG: CPBP family glutamic-type intramembrane protease [Acidimicrobiia bacterium]